jgi:hypothetical protein
VASRREGALARTGLAQGRQGVRGSGSHCRKMPWSWVNGGQCPESLKPTRSRALLGGNSRGTLRGASPFHEAVLRDAHLRSEAVLFAHPAKSRWRNFSSPFPSVTPALFDRLRSSGGELRRAPLSVGLRGQRATAQQQLLCSQFPVPWAGARRRACAGNRRARTSPLPASPSPPRQFGIPHGLPEIGDADSFS